MFQDYISPVKENMGNFRVTEGALRKALCARLITPVLQPVVLTPEGIPDGIEVLARWYLPDGSAVRPDAFIEQAVCSGLETAITRQLMEKTAPVVSRLAQSRRQPLVVGFNAGPECLISLAFESACLAFISACGNTGIIPAVEITEREPLTPALVPALMRLRKLGVKIVLDDFGSGYATPEILSWMSPDVVKLDRSLTALAGIGDPYGRLKDALEIVRHSGSAVLAEGVETVREYKWLYAHDVRLFQGYLFSHPVHLDHIEDAVLVRYC
ncbi:EAL domain-containing protein [Salmonella enterica subsp. enterica]|nr:EAL domain-containing protein [Salmonella enterica subsp. enterica]